MPAQAFDAEDMGTVVFQFAEQVKERRPVGVNDPT